MKSLFAASSVSFQGLLGDQGWERGKMVGGLQELLILITFMCLCFHVERLPYSLNFRGIRPGDGSRVIVPVIASDLMERAMKNNWFPGDT